MISKAASASTLIYRVGLKKLTPIVTVIEILQPFASITLPALAIATAFFPASLLLPSLKKIENIREWRIASALVAAICASYLTYNHLHPETDGDRLIFTNIEGGLQKIEDALARIEEKNDQTLEATKTVQSEIEIVKKRVEESQLLIQQGSSKKIPILEDTYYRLIETDQGGKLVATVDDNTFDIPTNDTFWHSIDEIADFNNDGYEDASLVYFSGGCCHDPSIEAVVLNQGKGQFVYVRLEEPNYGGWRWEPYGNGYRLFSRGYDEDYVYTFEETKVILQQTKPHSSRYHIATLDTAEEATKKRIFGDLKPWDRDDFVATMEHDIDGDGQADFFSCPLTDLGKMTGCEISLADRTIRFAGFWPTEKIGVSDEIHNGMSVLLANGEEYRYDPERDSYE